MSQQQAAYDSLAGLWYRYDESLRGMVYLHPETGAILRYLESSFLPEQPELRH
jgi:hypothetical protein